MTTIALLVLAFGLGVLAQTRYPVERARHALWQSYYHVFAPVLVLTTFVTIEVASSLVLALVAVVTASWLVGALAYAFAVLVASDRSERGALALTGAFGNTNAVGLPVAQLAYGSTGLELAVLYDRLAWLVPTQGVSVTVARIHGRPHGAGRVGLSRILLTNTPLFAMLVALVLRLGHVDVPGLAAVGEAIVAVIGPVSFLLLGLSLPLDPPSHTRVEIRNAVGAIGIRVICGPLVLVGIAQLTSIQVPRVFYLLAGMPCAFHLLTLGRVYDLRPALIRFSVTVSTAAVLIGVGTAVAVR